MVARLLIAAMLLHATASSQSSSARVCAGCHREIWQTYSETGMGRSFYKPSPANLSEDSSGKPYYHQPSDSYFVMIQHDGNYFQRRYQLDSSGREINVMQKKVDYVMGSGNHARTYLHRTPANTLIELPLGWYAEKGGYWAMNPGYDRPDHDGFRRPITYDCMFCHNAYPSIPALNEKPFSTAVYSGALPEGIDCQRCHGSGDRHIQLAGAGAKAADIRGAIVNPARLTPQRQMEICMICHLETTSFPLPNALTRYDRGPFSYRPGEPLEAFLLNFDHAPGTGREDKFEIVNAAYRLRRSACFLKSEGKLLCTTCHNPHDIPRGQAAQQRYTAICRQCHATAIDRLVATGQHTRDAACVDCHMPKRRTEDVVHVAATDHYIQRQKPAGDLLAERAERRDEYRGPVALYYPPALPHTADNDLLLAVAQVKQGSNLTQGIAQLTAAIARYAPARSECYLELADALLADKQLDKALPYYREAVRRDPGSAFAQRKLGVALRRVGQNAEAATVLQRAADSGDPIAWHELGLACRALGRNADAIAAIQKALTLDPDLPEAHNNLGIIRSTSGDPAHAEAEFREAIRIRPDYPDAHGNLANLLAGAGKFDDARTHFEIALHYRPGDAPTRYNYAMLLGRASRYDDAQRELEGALRADPDFAEAHELLANLLMAKGQAASAIPHYRHALRLKPESDRLHLGMGAALAASGDVNGALPYLQKAATSADAATRDQAAELLRQLGRRQ